MVMVDASREYHEENAMKSRLLMSGSLIAVASGWSSGSVVSGQVDAFDADVMGWTSSFGTPTSSWISGGGPGGVGDAYMQIRSSGASGGSGSRLGGWNGSQWSGDFYGQGVSAIRMDIAGFEGDATELRLMFISNSGSTYTSTLTQSIVSDAQWRTYTFDISEASLTPVGGSVGYADSFGDIWRMWIRHQPGDPAASGGAPAYPGRIGVDNIRAVPGIAGAGVLGVAGLMSGAKRRRR
tara:strand:- start:10260 stop:10973 length:714 start_codon:yes stop_codon:yes gene_type:complete